MDLAEETNPISVVTSKLSEDDVYVPGGFIRANGTSTKDRALFIRAPHVQAQINETLHSFPEQERGDDVKEENDEAEA